MTLKLFKRIWYHSFYFHVIQDLRIPQTCVKGPSIKKLKGMMSEFLEGSILLNPPKFFLKNLDISLHIWEDRSTLPSGKKTKKKFLCGY